tara:strand:+ start:331 stop:618 length:288 start_codon:yes stop_codon:yes gene_type:complete
MKLEVKIEDATLIYTDGDSVKKRKVKIGILPDNYNHDWDELLFEMDTDQQVYYWLTESEFREALTEGDELYPLSEDFILSISNNNKPFEIDLGER